MRVGWVCSQGTCAGLRLSSLHGGSCCYARNYKFHSIEHSDSTSATSAAFGLRVDYNLGMHLLCIYIHLPIAHIELAPKRNLDRCQTPGHLVVLV